LERLTCNEFGVWQYYGNMHRVNPERASQILLELDELGIIPITFLQARALGEAFISDKTSLLRPARGQDLQDQMSAESILESSVDLLCFYRAQVGAKLADCWPNISSELNNLSPYEMRLFKVDPLSVLVEKLPDGA
jgi:hypothetical protein